MASMGIILTPLKPGSHRPKTVDIPPEIAKAVRLAPCAGPREQERIDFLNFMLDRYSPFQDTSNTIPAFDFGFPSQYTTPPTSIPNAMDTNFEPMTEPLLPRYEFPDFTADWIESPSSDTSSVESDLAQLETQDYLEAWEALMQANEEGSSTSTTSQPDTFDFSGIGLDELLENKDMPWSPEDNEAFLSYLRGEAPMFE